MEHCQEAEMIQENKSFAWYLGPLVVLILVTLFTHMPLLISDQLDDSHVLGK